MVTIDALAARFGFVWKAHQREVLMSVEGQEASEIRRCLYHRTGAGKTSTALAAVALAGAEEALVIAPPATHDRWLIDGRRAGVAVTAISHAKFRMPSYLVSRTRAVIVDEFHMLGGHDKQGWKKMDRLAKSLKAPLIIASATPNYNDAERVYCIQHVMAPETVKGGYLDFLYQNCKTEQNPFGNEPIVTGFHQYKDAEAYLAALPYVYYLPDETTTEIQDVELVTELPKDFEEYGLDRRRGRIVASQMEERHRRALYLLVGETERMRPEVMDMLNELVGQATTPVLMFCNSSKIAHHLFSACLAQRAKVALLTGQDTTKKKAAVLSAFRGGKLDVLIGTATLATGVDGIDKMCDTLIIVNDTDDASLRRQLVGRILPRGDDTDESNKQVFRLLLSA